MILYQNNKHLLISIITAVFGAIPASILVIVPALGIFLSLAGIFTANDYEIISLMFLLLICLLSVLGVIGLWLVVFRKYNKISISFIICGAICLTIWAIFTNQATDYWNNILFYYFIVSPVIVSGFHVYNFYTGTRSRISDKQPYRKFH